MLQRLILHHINEAIAVTKFTWQVIVLKGQLSVYRQTKVIASGKDLERFYVFGQYFCKVGKHDLNLQKEKQSTLKFSDLPSVTLGICGRTRD